METTSLLHFISFVLPTVQTVHLTTFSSNQAFSPSLRLMKGLRSSFSRSTSDNIQTIIEETEVYVHKKFHCLIDGTLSFGKFLESLNRSYMRVSKTLCHVHN